LPDRFVDRKFRLPLSITRHTAARSPGRANDLALAARSAVAIGLPLGRIESFLRNDCRHSSNSQPARFNARREKNINTVLPVDGMPPAH
jgi:hypothetical protein